MIALKELKKRMKYKPMMFDYFYRKIAIYFIWAFLHTNITANQVTCLSMIVGIIGSLFFLGGPVHWIIAFMFLQLYRILDVVDGEIARYRKTAGKYGERLESIAIKVIDFSVFCCIGLGMYFVFNNILFIILGFLAGISKIGFGLIAKITPKQKEFRKRSNIISRFSSEIGSFFQITIVFALLDLIFETTYFRSLFILVCGLGFPLVFIWRYLKRRL